MFAVFVDAAAAAAAAVVVVQAPWFSSSGSMRGIINSHAAAATKVFLHSAADRQF